VALSPPYLAAAVLPEVVRYVDGGVAFGHVVSSCLWSRRIRHAWRTTPQCLIPVRAPCARGSPAWARPAA